MAHRSGPDVSTHLRDRATYRLALISRRLALALAALHQKRHGLSINSWKVLSVIGGFGPLSAGEVGAHSSLEPTTVTRTADTLVRRGLVARREDAEDRRRVVLSLSAEGERVHDEILAVSSSIEAECLGALTPHERETLHVILEKLDRRSREAFAGTANSRLSMGEAPRGRPKAGGRARAEPAKSGREGFDEGIER